MRSVLIVAMLSALCAPALAEDTKAVAAPSFKAGDSWVYDQTIEKGPAGFGQERLDIAIERVDDATMSA